MSKFAEECKRRIAEAGVEPRGLKVEYKAVDPKLIEWGLWAIPGAMRVEKDYFKDAIESMVEEFKNPSECQKLYEANLQLEAVKKEANYWETKCEKINRVAIKYKVKSRDMEKKIADLEHENAHLRIKYEEALKKETRFETSYTKKHSELVKEAAEIREENAKLIRNSKLQNETIEIMDKNISVFIDEVNTLWGDIVNIDLESKEGKEKFKELQIMVIKSKNLLDLALGIK